MAWGEWEQLKAEAAQSHSAPMRLNQAPSGASGSGEPTVGAATQEAGGIPGADDIILLGSPGVGVDRAEDLGVGKEHVFVGAAENDPVSKLPSKAQTGAGLVTLPMGPAVTRTVGDLFDPGDDDIWFGRTRQAKHSVDDASRLMTALSLLLMVRVRHLRTRTTSTAQRILCLQPTLQQSYPVIRT